MKEVFYMSKYPTKPTAITFTINYSYEKQRLANKISDFQTWFAEIYQTLKKLAYDKNMASAVIAHDADFKRTDDKSDFLLDLNGNKVAEDDHIHGILISYDKVQARLPQWATLLEQYGLHISKINTKNQTQSNIQGLSTTAKNVKSALAYLVHATPMARKMQKCQYSTNNVKLINFEQFFGVSSQLEAEECYEKLVNQQKQIQVKYDIDDFKAFYRKQRQEIDAGTSLRDLELEYKKRFTGFYADYERIFGQDLRSARVRYLQNLSTQLPHLDRKFSFIQITGVGGVGKSRLASALGGLLAGNDMRIHLAGTPEKRKTPDLLSTYQDELVTVVHELRSSSFTVDGFESFMDPHVYPTVNSRNSDKPYFAQNFISANSQDMSSWLYNLLYYDLLYSNNCDKNVDYITTVNEHDSFPFPGSYSRFIDTLEDDSDSKRFLKDHWNLNGMREFLDQWWQLVRRVSFIIELSPDPFGLERYAFAKIWKLNPDSRPKGLTDFNYLKNAQLFENDFKLYHHFTCIRDGLPCTDITNESDVADFAKIIYIDLVQAGITTPTTLPKLLTPSELRQKTGLMRPLVALKANKKAQK